jgi:S-formylglutathione hydrolase FrmB
MAHRIALWTSSALVLFVAVGMLAGSNAEADGVEELQGAPGQPLPLQRVRTDAKLGEQLQFMRVNSRALQGNLLGDPHARELGVLLPPSYFTAEDRRYPVVYLLHGLGRKSDGHLDNLDVQRAAYARMLTGELPELIVVAVDGSTSLGGSYYARSPAIGDFETYVVQELVGAVDARYRTFADARGRALGGFSMGGHGALKLAMKYPGVFSGVGTLSASPLSLRDRTTLYRNAVRHKRQARTADELEALYPFERAWTTASIYAKAAAFSSDASRPPLYLELPFQRSDGANDPVWQQWAQEEPLALLSTYSRSLRTLDTLYMDRGDQEKILGADAFDRALERHGIPGRHHVFSGGHSDRYVERHLRMLLQLSMRWAPGA